MNLYITKKYNKNTFCNLTKHFTRFVIENVIIVGFDLN